MLLEAVQENDAACIEVGMRLTQLREDDKEVKLDFEGGETRSSSILLGADGVHSTVRTLRHPQLGAQYTGHVAYRG